MTRTDIINHLIKTRGYKSYLEIGVQQGANFNAIECEWKVGVDPDPASIPPEVEQVGSWVIMEQRECLTSDQFFKDNIIIGRTFDIGFVDGLHHSEQALRDIYNLSQILTPGGCRTLYCLQLMPLNNDTRIGRYP